MPMMDFEVSGSDSWGTDAFQEQFISDYFGSNSLVASTSGETKAKNSTTKTKKSKLNNEDSDNRDHNKRKKQKFNHPDHTMHHADSGTPSKLNINERLLSIAKCGKDHFATSPLMSNLQSKSKSKKKKKNKQMVKCEIDKGNELHSSVVSETEHKNILPVESKTSSERKLLLNNSNNNRKGVLSGVMHLSQEQNRHSQKLKKRKKDYNNNKDVSMRNINSHSEDEIIMARNDNHIKFKSKKSKNKDLEFSEEDCISCHSDEADTEVPDRDTNTKSALLRQKALSNLQAARFRLLNEKLYTVPGIKAYEYFRDNIDDFKAYHDGYQLQVKKWPINPVDLIIEDLRHRSKSSVIADLGCGDAKIARTFRHQKVYSFDLVALNEHVTCCDISNVPLPNESVDIAVFCLSLMGINLSDYLLQAFRILKQGGLLKIAEVESRIGNLEEFMESIEDYGFQLANKDISHKMFVLLDFKKVKQKVKKSKLQAIKLLPCLYKKR